MHTADNEVSSILNAMQEICNSTCVRFRPYQESDRNWIELTSDHNGCWSSVGMKSGGQIVNLGSAKCLSRGVIMHELMHVCGFFHQQSASERDQFIKIHWENIRRGREHNFQKYNESAISNYNVSYDYESIMHYSARAFSRNGQPTIEPIVRKKLYAKSFEAINKIFCFHFSSNLLTLDKGVDSVKRMS